MAYPRPRNKGQRCSEWQRVKGRGGRRLLRCKQFSYPPRRFQMGYPPGHVPANYGATCLRRKSVMSPWYNKKVWRCAKYGPGVSGPRMRPFRSWFNRYYRTHQGPVMPGGRIPLSMRTWEESQAGRTPDPEPRRSW
jgi:hypothetical protein